MARFVEDSKFYTYYKHSKIKYIKYTNVEFVLII